MCTGAACVAESAHPFGGRVPVIPAAPALKVFPAVGTVEWRAAKMLPDGELTAAELAREPHFTGPDRTGMALDLDGDRFLHDSALGISEMFAHK